MILPNDNTSLIDRIEQQFGKVVKDLQRELFGVAVGSLTSYLTDDANRLTFTVRNINRANAVGVRVNVRSRRRRGKILSFLLDAFDQLFRPNREYYDPNTPESVHDAARRRVLLLYGYDTDKEVVIEGGYFEQVLQAGEVGSQVSQVINNALASRSDLSDLRKRLRQAMNPTARQGLTEAQFTRLTRDLFAEYDRTIKLEYKERLGLKYALYAGTEMDETRPFCSERYGLIYTEKEIASWNTQEWQGKKPGPVEIVCGGYNCRHTLNWVTDEVAQTFIQRRGGVDKYREGVGDG